MIRVLYHSDDVVGGAWLDLERIGRELCAGFDTGPVNYRLLFIVLEDVVAGVSSHVEQTQRNPALHGLDSGRSRGLFVLRYNGSLINDMVTCG
ncbi:hypothetical protein BaRGS_00018268 [Batillaria attramentaria]|uniref:Uncharacterized protein n=1 Tax=Batillaria attramentaria TaxID=370345 RepID=A0ABD0KUM2_9CAEN